MILDVLFVFGFGLEVAGVAWATFIAEYAMLALGILLVRRHFGRLETGLSFKVLLDGTAIRRLAAVNGDIVLRSLTLQVAFVSLVAFGSRQGEVILGANTVLANLLHLSAYALDGFAFAASTLVGRHVGAGDRIAMREAVNAAIVWSFGFSLIITAVFALGGDAMIGLITDIDQVRASASAYLPYIVAGPIIGAAAFAFDGIYVGATRTREMRNGMIGALAVFGLAAWLLIPPFGNHGLWLTYLAFMIARSAWLWVVYWRLERGAGFMMVPTGTPVTSAKADSET